MLIIGILGEALQRALEHLQQQHTLPTTGWTPQNKPLAFRSEVGIFSPRSRLVPDRKPTT